MKIIPITVTTRPKMWKLLPTSTKYYKKVQCIHVKKLLILVSIAYLSHGAL